MEITDIPFNKFIQISAHDDSGHGAGYILELGFKENMKNHLGTFHASAQFALAEACSGVILQNKFPQLENRVVPVLRKSEVKFRKPASSKIIGKGYLKEDAESKFLELIEKKGRASISVVVDIFDEENTVTMSGTFDWFVQKLEA